MVVETDVFVARCGDIIIIQNNNIEIRCLICSPNNMYTHNKIYKTQLKNIG